jgi:HJR/Mrr/RecB family endonuclease
MPTEDSLFAWRTYERVIEMEFNTVLYEIESPIELNGIFHLTRNLAHDGLTCPYCSSDLLSPTDKFEDDGERAVYCKQCGWGKESSSDQLSPFHSDSVIQPYFIEIETSLGNKTIYDELLESPPELIILENKIRVFNLNSAELSNSELAQYFKSHFKKINNFSPYRFENLVGSIFGLQGFRVEQTIRSRDGGYDLKLFNNNYEQILVEIKRRKDGVGVSIVRQIMGVQLIEGYRKAKIVTNSYFTSIAKKAARSENYLLSGYELELIDGEELLRLLGAYKQNHSLIDFSKMKSRNHFLATNGI